MRHETDSGVESGKRRRMLLAVGIAAVAITVTAGTIYAVQRGHETPAASPHTSTSTSVPYSTAEAPATTAIIGARTKTAECHANGPLADGACTPGAVIAVATKEQICVPGYSKSVRNVPASEKKAVYAEYGIALHITGQYEVDHLISLELGGSNDIANLWPELAEPKPGFHQKDAVENYLHAQVCTGKIALELAQQEIANNWMVVYDSMPR